jgi:Flp pilus assembly pilin Flp
MRKLFQNFRSDESGATLVEYGVALLVAIVVGGIALTSLAESTTVSMETAETVLPDSTDLTVQP